MMFYSVIPPPPPRYTLPVAYAAGTVNGMPVPVLETVNVIKHPEGGCDLQVPEGTYTLRDDLVLATPPPHPTEAPITSTNPLTTTPTPPTCGVKITPVFLEGPAKEPRYFPARISGTVKYPNVDTRRGRCGSQELAPIYGESNPAMYNNDREKEKEKDKNLDNIAMGQKRRKPKSNIVKSGSSFISRVLNHEGAARRMLDRDPHGMYLFANINRAFHWLDAANKNKQDPLSKILFTKAHIICHAVNEYTKSPTHLDVIMGSNSGDILWYEPVSQKYSRINKNGIISKSSVNDIKWVPGSENLFIAATGNGSLVVYDKEREDVPFVSEEIELDGAPSNLGPSPRGMNMGMGNLEGAMDNLNIRDQSTTNGEGTAAIARSPGMVGFAPGTAMQQDEGMDANDAAFLRSKFRILKSANSPHQTKNPVASYKLSHLSVTQLAFSPDNRHLAVVLEDCTLRIIDFLAEEQLDIFHAYYGGINCVAWSPDGKYLVTGGQDDLVTIWSFKEKRIVARCQGHTSFVRSVAFDPFRCECEKGEYRFGSVGEDCRLLLWDFSPAMVHRPKYQHHRQRNSTITAASHYPPTLSLSLSLSHTYTHNEAMRRERDRRPTFTVNHPVEKRSATAQLPPILSKKVSDDPLFSIVFFEDGIVTSSLEGHIRTWDRPSTEPDNKSHSLSQTDSLSLSQSQQQPYIRYPSSDVSSYPSPPPPRRASTAVSVGMSDGSSGVNGGGAGSYSGHSWNANGINTNEWVDANGWRNRENRYGSNSTGQSSLQSSQISPSQTLHEGAKS